MEEKYKLAVFIGRFQPFHIGHQQVVEKALGIADRVLIILGSHKSAPTVKNPFNAYQRSSMIMAGLGYINDSTGYLKEPKCPVKTSFVRDYYYSDFLWLSNVQSIVQNEIEARDISDSEVCLIANYKDDSSYYLDYFPQWDRVQLWGDARMDATTVRQALFNPNCGTEDFKKYLPEGTFNWLLTNYVGTPAHVRLIQEASQVESDKRKYGDGISIATDAIVVKSGHVLMIKRKGKVGNGLLALPGGFVQKNERIKDSCIRELKEETKIDVEKAVLKEKIKTAPEHVFDHPGRDVRSRVISHAFFIDLGKGPLPRVKGSDDAEHAMWVPFMDLYSRENEIYADHLSIISHFIKGGQHE